MYPGKWARQFPDKVAALNSDTGASLTYRELNDRSNRLAQLFWADGLRSGDHVAVFMENNLSYFEVIWAALRSGLYITTINRYLTDEEAGYILDNCEAQALVTSAALSEIAVELPRFAPGCKRWLMVGNAAAGYEDYEATLASFPAKVLDDEPAGAFMLYSSGTTGRPKGILRPLTGLKIHQDAGPVGALQKALWGFGTDTVYLSPAPLYHSAPIGFCTAVQALGGTVIMMPRFDEIGALRAIERFKVTHSQWVPTMFTRMLKLPPEDREGFDLSSHKVAIHAAAPCPAGIKQQMFDWWGPILYEYYGGTELNGLTHTTPEEWLAHPGTVGRPVIGTLHICNEEGAELPVGEPGLVYFELPQMPFEYLKDPEKTRSAQHPQHANWSALGDVGYMDKDGFLYLTDRATFMIISGGVNIYPQEIEDVLIMHPKIADVAVVGVPNEEMGEEVKAVVQLAADQTPGDEIAEEILAYAREHIARFKCPRSVDFMAELPRLPTGKLYKRLIKDAYWAKTKSRIV
ncbi:MAG: acyl-CoA synthetase [Pseudomonadales bacterium]|nr:acyl-CoA synthetase [Pseudomonadales bacterium]